MVGDETVELWLKRGAGAWALEQSVPADVSNPPFQDFLVLGLESGLQHAAQIRVFRDGRYRAGYIGGDPEAWPEQSRIDFIPGAEAAPPPEIIAAVFERTSAIAHQITLTITPNPGALALDLDILRDGVVVGTVEGPHVGDVEFIDEDPPIASYRTYTARHRQFTLDGELSDPFIQWIGPPAPTDLVQVAEISDYYAYHIDWTNVGGSVRVRDDWPVAGFINRTLLGSGSTHHDQAVEKESLQDEGSDEVVDFCQVEIRHEVGAFAVTDVSDWVGVSCSVTMHSDETAH
jgi:hypothetical protein